MQGAKTVRPDGVSGEFRVLVDIFEEVFPHVEQVDFIIGHVVFLINLVVKDDINIQVSTITGLGWKGKVSLFQ